MENIQSTPEEAQPLELIEGYLNALEAMDITNYQRTADIIDGIFCGDEYQPKFPETYVIREAIIYERTQTPSRLASLNLSRTFSAVDVASRMIQGDQIPVKDFQPILDRVVSAVSFINGHYSDRKARKLVRQEIKSIWELKQDEPDSKRRIAEAYALVGGSPFTYGAMMVEVARPE